MVKQGKKYTSAFEKIDKDLYSPEDAIALAKKVSDRNFDEAVELHIVTSADPRHSDQQIRGFAELPHGTGKQIKILVFAEGDAAYDAKKAGADIIADEEVIKKIQTGWSEFDVSIATPDQMSKIGKLGRYLGRKGLMPNPRTGTVVQGKDITKAIEASRKGRVEIKMDKTSIIHLRVGTVSFSEQQLQENLKSIMSTLISSRPKGIKGKFLKKATMATTMGPGIKIDVNGLENMVANN